MNRVAVALITTSLALLTGCVEPLMPKVTMDAKSAAFPYHGIYTGTATGGTFTYRIDAGGRGLGLRTHHQRADDVWRRHLRWSDTSQILHTEDGDLEVVSASYTGLRLRTPHMSAKLRKVDAPPTVCVYFLRR